MANSNRSRLLLVGFGFAAFLAMNSFSLWGFSTLPQRAFGAGAASLWCSSMMMGNVASFFMYALAAALVPKAFDRRPFPEAAGLLFAGIVLLLGFYLTDAEAMLFASGILYGIGTTCCFICWEYVFALSAAEEARKQIILGSVLAAAPFLVYVLIDRQAVLLVMLLLAMLCLASLFACLRLPDTSGAGHGTGIGSRSAVMKDTLVDLAPSLFCLAMIGLASTMLESGMVVEAPSFIGRGFIVYGANIASAVVLAAAWGALHRSTSITKAFMVFYPLLITALLFFPFLRGDQRMAVVFMGTFGFTLFSVVMMMSCIDCAKRTGLSLAVAYPLSAGVLYAFHHLGSDIAGLMAGSSIPRESQATTAAFLLLYGCSLAVFLINGRSGAKRQASVVVPGSDIVSARCRLIADENGFSERQSEVFDLLAHGHDIPSIARRLYTSENTVRTHAKKIYASLEVHSKQDIIDLVNPTRPVA